MKKIALFLAVLIVFGIGFTTTSMAYAQNAKEPVYYGLTEDELINIFAEMKVHLEFLNENPQAVYYVFKKGYDKVLVVLAKKSASGRYNYLRIQVSYFTMSEVPIKVINEWNKKHVLMVAVKFKKKTFLLREDICLCGVSKRGIKTAVRVFFNNLDKAVGFLIGKVF